MTSVTYNGESQRIEWHGVAFEKGKAVPVDKPELLRAADKNPLFKVTGKVPEPEEDGEDPAAPKPVAKRGPGRPARAAASPAPAPAPEPRKVEPARMPSAGAPGDNKSSD